MPAARDGDVRIRGRVWREPRSAGPRGGDAVGGLDPRAQVPQ
ncbi:hypothetical protein JD79_04052 [Geodermatophilus normandii]|uniref:Uncharacterized protein n=1 Tax=Geodermatophilus normandii TaxID=1137989 RepID=A0A317QPZ1_9ACTN|nr:hypothetical protein JD79_04052 [Geodermatophilus normandii]